MSVNEIYDKLVEILNDQFSESEISESVIRHIDFIDDEGMESIEFISLIIRIEDVFNVTIPDEWLEMDRFRKFDYIEESIKKLISKEGLDHE